MTIGRRLSIGAIPEIIHASLQDELLETPCLFTAAYEWGILLVEHYVNLS